MTARHAALGVGTRVRYEVGGLTGTGTVVALDSGSTFGVAVHGDRGPAMSFRTSQLTILPAEDVPPSDDAGGETEGRVERSTGTTTPAPCPSAADVIAAADDFLRVAQEQQDHYDNRRPLHGDAMEDLVRERFEALRAAVRAFP